MEIRNIIAVAGFELHEPLTSQHRSMSEVQNRD
jgi:hypothetical protein